MAKLTVNDLAARGKRVLVRVDYNVPMEEKDGQMVINDTTRIKVPLLYTVSTPVLLDDSTLRAELAHNCQRAEPYRVSLRTGRPVPLRP